LESLVGGGPVGFVEEASHVTGDFWLQRWG
jgi:hypothetical protein